MQPVFECTFHMYILLFPIRLDFDAMGSFLNNSKSQTISKIHFCVGELIVSLFIGTKSDLVCFFL